MANFYFLHGKDTFILKTKLNQLKDKFVKTNSALDIIQLEGRDLSRDNFISLVGSLPFFCDKRLIIIKNLLIENSDSLFKKYVGEQLLKLPDHIFILFVEEGEPDKRGSLYKALAVKGHSIECSGNNEFENTAKIKKSFLENGLEINPQEIRYLINMTSNDSWLLFNSIEKIILYKKAKQDKRVNTQDIDELVQSQSVPKIFGLTDAIAEKQIKKSVELLHDLLKSGTNEMQILAVIISQYRTLLQIESMVQERFPRGQIAKELRLPPFVIDKNIILLKKYSYLHLVKIYKYLQMIDSMIKRGIIESKIALDIMVVKLCRS